MQVAINLICAWSDAMARDRSANYELGLLKEADAEMSFTLAQAVCAVELCHHKAVMEPDENFTDLPDWHPDHPQQRLENIRWLKKELGCDDMSLIV